MYSLSINAIEQYRKGARNGADIPVDVLKVKLNCLCQAGRKTNIPNGIKHGFGKCVIEVRDNIITKVYWDNNRNHTVAQWEGDRLRRLFKRNGLDESGNKWLEIES